MIKVENLDYTYPGNNTPTIKGLNFSVGKGEILGFLGPNGAGKSTTQKILIKLLGNFQGNIQIEGKNLKKWSSDYYNFIGVGFELPNHYMKLTGLENLQFFASFYDVPTQDPMDLLQMVGLSKDANKRVESYSKGMKVRLNFIRALLHKPSVLFLDEPTTGLDPTNARIIKDIIKVQKKEGKTILLTTHNMTDADELCDRVAFIADGKIMAIESPHLLKLRNSKRKLKVEWNQNGSSLKTSDFPLDEIGRNTDFLELIKTKDIQSIHSEEASLESVFIQLTGKSLK